MQNLRIWVSHVRGDLHAWFFEGVCLITFPISGGNIFLPIMVGSPEVAFPRLNSISFWILPFSFFFLMLSMFSAVGNAYGPGCGWTIYPPLSTLLYSPGVSVDFLIGSLHLAGLSSLFGAINFIVTFVHLRSVKLFDIPLFAWSIRARAKRCSWRKIRSKVCVYWKRGKRSPRSYMQWLVNDQEWVMICYISILCWKRKIRLQEHIRELINCVNKSMEAHVQYTINLHVANNLSLLVRTGGRRTYNNCSMSDEGNTGESTLEISGFVEKWCKERKLQDKDLWLKYRNPNTKSSVFGISNVECISTSIDSYNIIVSKVLHFHKKLTKEDRIVSHKLPLLITKIQNVFIESFGICVYAVKEIEKSQGGGTSGVNGEKYKTLSNMKKEYQENQIKNTRYAKSKKLWKIKKDLPLRARIDLERENILLEEMKQYNLELSLNLLKKCNMLSIRKNYKADTIRQIWIDKLLKPGHRPLGIPSLRDRVLQTIILNAVHPIIEFQSDPLSFGFRKYRNAIQAISFIYRRVGQSRRVGRRSNLLMPVTVSKTTYDKAECLKTSIRTRLIDREAKMRRRQYNRVYQIYPRATCNNVPVKFKHRRWYKFLNVDIENCFGSINHQSILKYFPITQKYKFLICAWLRGKVYGKKEPNSLVDTSWYSKRGVPQGSVIGPACCNCVLDGLDKVIQFFPKTKYEVNIKMASKWLRELENGGKKNPAYDRVSKIRKFNAEVHCVRFVDDIFIFGFMDWRQLIIIQKKLQHFLRERGLSIKDKGKFQGKLFKPGVSFDYLGFCVVFPRKTEQILSGKFTKLQRAPWSFRLNRRITYLNSGVFLMISDNSKKKHKLDLKRFLTRSAIPKSIKSIIEGLNSLIRGFCNYFHIDGSITLQMKSFDFYMRKRLKKLLISKYQSKPKTMTYVKTLFFENGKIRTDGAILLEHKQTRPYGGRSVWFMGVKYSFWKTNIYLDKYLHNKNKVFQLYLNSQQKI